MYLSFVDFLDRLAKFLSPTKAEIFYTCVMLAYF